ncbi:protein FAR1-related sequence 11 [Tanacetum coccineum]
MQTVAGDGVAGIKRRRRDLYSDGVRNLATTSGRGRLKEDLESSTWRLCQDYKATKQKMKEGLPFDLNEVPIDEDVFDLEGQTEEENIDVPFVGQCFLSEEEALVFLSKGNGFGRVSIDEVLEHIIPFDLNEVPIDEDVVDEEGQIEEENVDEPFVGQCFLSEEEASIFYQKYAKISGFSVRKGRFENKKGENKGERKRRNFFCHRKGKPEDKLVDLAIEDVEQKQMHDTMLVKYRGSCLRSLSPLEEQGRQLFTPFAFKKF